MNMQIQGKIHATFEAAQVTERFRKREFVLELAAMSAFWGRIRSLLDDKLVRHFRETHAPVQELSLATSVGLFWALTPLVGIQMSLVAATWALFRFAGLRFHLGIAIAFVWITNPATLPFFYYGFYMVGRFFFLWLDVELKAISIGTIQQLLLNNQQLDFWTGVSEWIRLLTQDLGQPMLIGGLIVGLPCAIFGYFLTAKLVNSYRRRLAHNMDLNLRQWEDRFVYHKETTGENRQ